jgi:hypothetical protein
MKTPQDKTQAHIKYLKRCYGGYVKKWDGVYQDDRQLFCNIYHQLVESYAEMSNKKINNSSIWVALGKYRQEKETTLNEIIERFKNKE